MNYTDVDGDTVIARYTVTEDPDLADPASTAMILQIPQPAANHNGGLLLFGPDGYLWIGTGDGGGPGAELPRAQDPKQLLGKMLRIDVDGGPPYAVPPENPFVGSPNVAPEIWAFGLRNPWRYAFDRATGDLYIADVGQERFEWVHVVPAGSSGGINFGWPIAEGLHCQPEGVSCDRSNLRSPVAEYDHQQGCGIIGGHVYRGAAFPLARGTYFFSDFCSGRIWGLRRQDSGNWMMEELLVSGLTVSSFGEDEGGELYLTAIQEGALYRLTFKDGTGWPIGIFSRQTSSRSWLKASLLRAPPAPAPP